MTRQMLARQKEEDEDEEEAHTLIGTKPSCFPTEVLTDVVYNVRQPNVVGENEGSKDK